MKIFILEDDGDRCKIFANLFAEHNMIITNNAETGIMLLNDRKFDRIFLDHDLGGVAMVDITEENTGTTLCNKLNDKNKDTPVIIHSWNPMGAYNMRRILEVDKSYTDVQETPFSDFIIQEIIKEHRGENEFNTL